MWVGSTTMLTAVREPMTAARIMEDGALRVAARRAGGGGYSDCKQARTSAGGEEKGLECL